MDKLKCQNQALNVLGVGGKGIRRNIAVGNELGEN
jgi:hypothetical protein